MKENYSKSGWSGFLLVIVILVGVSAGCKELLSNAKGKIVQQSCESDAGVVNGEMDYGVTVKLRVKNVGEAGTLKITAAISSSEGEWKKNQTLTFRAGEEKSLTYFFHEPTINVRNVECQLGVSPDAD